MPYQITLFFKDQSRSATELKQVWFSGGHADVGGGMQDPRLSNIALGWMISELESKKLLAFDRNYLLELNSNLSNENPQISAPWKTRQGVNNEEYAGQCEIRWHFWHKLFHRFRQLVREVVQALKWTVVHLLYLLPNDWGRQMSGVRTPREYVRIVNFKRVKPNNEDGDFVTCEYLHDSIKHRWLGAENGNPKVEGAKKWPCQPLKGFQRDGASWRKNVTYKGCYRWVGYLSNYLHHKGQESKPLVLEILQNPAHKIEETFKNRMRFEKRCNDPWKSR
jgi:hypothetical protein